MGFFRKMVTDFSSRASQGKLFHKRGAATTKDECRYPCLAAVRDATANLEMQ